MPRGVFIALAMGVRNTGSAPVDGLFDTELAIDGRYYSQDDTATNDITFGTPAIANTSRFSRANRVALR